MPTTIAYDPSVFGSLLDFSGLVDVTSNANLSRSILIVEGAEAIEFMPPRANCRNCGAASWKRSKCEYCGTQG